MKLLRKGARGRNVRFLQLVLNTHLRRKPNLKVDGIFGGNTEKKVRDYQTFSGKTVDGIVGQNTWRSLLEPAKISASNLRKFKLKLGTASDFVNFIQRLEKNNSEPESLLKALTNFQSTMPKNDVRYLLIKQNPYVIDFRHFFASASEAFGGYKSKTQGTPIGGTEGETLLLGVGNELGQCIDEGLKLKLNSCFAREDLGSNRLGAEFEGKLRV